ncbi:MAG: NUDIX domain-containing protein [Clostridiales bacterium]|nr:NUDIX domain-containing protein [Clostridiales bacterium]
MIIRNSAKGIIIRGNKLLVVELENNGRYYTLPGGKQEPNELMLDALKREMLEETGYDVNPIELLFIRETFEEDGETHRVEFMVLCEIVAEVSDNKFQYDEYQVGTKWINIDNISEEPLYPVELRKLIKNFYLGKRGDVYQGVMNQRSVSFGGQI